MQWHRNKRWQGSEVCVVTRASREQPSGQYTLFEINAHQGQASIHNRTERL